VEACYQNNSASISGLVNTYPYNLFVGHRRKYLMLMSEMCCTGETVLPSLKNL